ncbi:hypothetical protein GQ53DRAFT_701345 [Thozetella sp. PMI_491]|nr:hypothetical protein GQ53DRAFT_701345 [Thozetella sp. PMI_491]
MVHSNTTGVKYRAVIESDVIHGSVTALSMGIGINYTIGLHQLPVERGPFKYHIHVNPVPANGSCDATGGHLDPYVRGDSPACDDKAPATCQIGDLSGKYGIVIGPSGLKMFNDPYTSLDPGSIAFIANRSAVFHDKNGTRVGCANFEKI